MVNYNIYSDFFKGFQPLFAILAKLALFLVKGFLECVSSSVDLLVAFLVAVNFPLFFWVNIN